MNSVKTYIHINDSNTFVEIEHPRKEDGEFTKGAASTKVSVKTNTVSPSVAPTNKVKSNLKVNASKIPEGWAKKLNDAKGDQVEFDKQLANYGMHNLHEVVKYYDKDTVVEYGAYLYKRMNAALNNADNSNPKVQAQIASMRRAIKASYVPTQMTVYRGVKASLTEIIGTLDPSEAIGRTFVHKGFASTSRNEKIATQFAKGKTLIKFNLPAGVSAMVMPSQSTAPIDKTVPSYMSNKDEAEVVLNDHAMFRIDKIEQNVGRIKCILHVTWLGHQKEAENAK